MYAVRIFFQSFRFSSTCLNVAFEHKFVLFRPKKKLFYRDSKHVTFLERRNTDAKSKRTLHLFNVYSKY